MIDKILPVGDDYKLIVILILAIAVVAIVKHAFDFLIVLFMGSKAQREYKHRPECHDEENLTGRCLKIDGVGCRTTTECGELINSIHLKQKETE